MLVYLLICFCLILLIISVCNLIRRPVNYPPGPRWLPLVGNVPELKKLSRVLGGQHLALAELAKKYSTNVLGLKLGRDNVVAVFNYPIVREVLTREEFEGRPDNFFIRLRSFGTRKGITCTDGPFWHEQRNFLTRHMRNLGYGKKSMEVQIQTEVEEILEVLNTQGPNIELNAVFAVSVLNVIWSIVTGNRIPRESTRLSSFLALLHKRSKAFDMSGGILSQFPCLRYIMPEQTGYNLLVQINSDLRKFFKEAIDEHYNNWYPDRHDDLIFTYITQIKKLQGRESTFTDDQLVMICLDLFVAGANTTSSTLDFIFLMMLLHPDIQEKAVNQINSVITTERPLTYADRLILPYLEAIILEVERVYAVAPIIGPRRVLRDTTLDGYSIPKGTTILISLDSVHKNINYWEDPQVFRPERFLNKDGQLHCTDRVVNFGLGRRRCLGELLARQCIFLFFVEIIRRFTILPVPGINLPSVKPLSGLTLSPEKYKVHIIPRNENSNS